MPLTARGRTEMLRRERLHVAPATWHFVTLGEGPPLVLLHGFPEFWYAWKDALPVFAKHYLTIAVDLPGFDLSVQPNDLGLYTFERVALSLRDLLQVLGCERCIVVGHDLGGEVAWELAARCPDLVERLVILNAPHPAALARELLCSAQQRQASAYMHFLSSAGAAHVLARDGYSRLFALLNTAARPWVTDLDEMAYRSAWSRTGTLRSSLNYYRALTLKPPRTPEEHSTIAALADRLQALHVASPTLVLWGEQDPALCPALIEGIERWVDSIDVVRLRQFGHWALHESPTAILGMILEWLQQPLTGDRCIAVIDPPRTRP